MVEINLVHKENIGEDVYIDSHNREHHVTHSIVFSNEGKHILEEKIAADIHAVFMKRCIN